MGAISRPELNVIGYLTTASGVGQVARGYAAVLDRLGYEVGHGDISLSDGPKVDAERWLSRSLSKTSRVNLIVSNPLPVHISEIDRRIGFETLRRSYNIGSWWWELDGPPPASWANGATHFDEVWAGTTFIERVFSKTYDLPVKLVPPVVQLVPETRLTRDDFQWKKEEFVFLFICDFMSIPQRKNPLAVVRAFRSAFHKSERARLILKVINDHVNRQYWATLKEACADANITLIDARLDRSQMDALTSLADCYISLHRSEGFGLTLAEAMLAGKPVIGTAYSGNMDFMTEENSYLVPYDFIEVGRDVRPYTPGAQWAEPRHQEAAAIMRSIFEDQDTAQQKALLGQQFIKSRYSVDAVAKVVEKALPTITCDAPAMSKLARTFYALQSTGIDANPSLELPSVDIHSVNAVPLVSVCLPVYNGQEYLAEAIESALAQTYANFELLIGDDCSTDDSAQIIERYAAIDSRIKHWRNLSRLGLFANYNECMRRSIGAYIKPFAQDDLIEPTFLELAVSTMQREPELSLFVCRRGHINEHGVSCSDASTEAAYASNVPMDALVPGKEAIAQCLMPVVNKIGEPSTVMFRREHVDYGFDERFYHIGDLDYWVRLLARGDYFISSQQLCQFRVHGSSTTTGNMKSLLFGIDLLRFGKKHESILLSLSQTWEDYRDCEMNNIANYACWLTEGDLFFGAQALQNSTAAIDQCAFRELAFYALRLGLKDSDRSPHKAASDAKLSARIKLLEEEVRIMLASDSWKRTKPLRDFKRTVFRSSKNDELELKAGDSLSDLEYYFYLVHLRATVVSSASWMLTAPLRMPSKNAESRGVT